MAEILLYTDPLEACKALVGESYKLWIEREDRTDDITIILGFIEPPGQQPPAVAETATTEKNGDDEADDGPAEEVTETQKKKTRRGSLKAAAAPGTAA